MNTFEGKSLLLSLSEGFSSEELCLAGLQAAIAAEISMKRQEMGMNQSQFAKFMGVSQGLVSKWESGEANFTLSSLVNIASKLDFEIQCPFVINPAPVYYDSVKTNIIPFNKAAWTSIVSTSTGYDDSELLEM